MTLAFVVVFSYVFQDRVFVLKRTGVNKPGKSEDFYTKEGGVVVNHQVGAGNWFLVLFKNKCC